MFGQGSPPHHFFIAWFGLPLAMILMLSSAAQPLKGDDTETGMRMRFSFGGSEPAIWSGFLELPNPCSPKSVRILGVQQDHAGRIYPSRSRIVINLIQPARYGGLEFEIEGKPTDKISYSLTCTVPGQEAQSLTGTVSLSDLVESPHAKQASKSDSRIYLERAPGDEIKFLTTRRSMVFNNHDKLQFGVAVSPFSSVDMGTGKLLTATIRSSQGTKEIQWSSRTRINELAEVYPLETDLNYPPGVYDLTLELAEPATIPFSQSTSIAKRMVQFVVVDNRPVQPFDVTTEDVELVYENSAGKQETFPRSRFKSWERFNQSARNLFKNFPLAAGRSEQKKFNIATQSLKLFPLILGKHQQLHKIEIEYESPGNIECDIVLFDRESPNYKYSDLATKSIKTKNDSGGGKREIESMVFWNRSTDPVLMVRNLDSNAALQIKAIRVYQFKSGIENFKLYSNQNRRVFTQFSAEQFSRILAAPKSFDQQRFPLDDWNTFLSGGKRLIQLIKSADYQGAVVDVNSRGSGLYPSNRLQFSPASDTGIFAIDGRDPRRKDVMDLLFRQFTANGLTLIPRIEIPRFVAAFESADQSYQSELRLQKLDGSYSQTYNHLNPHVQEYVSELILELTERYSSHPSFGGICLRIGSNHQLVLGQDNGFNKQLVEDFLNQQSIKTVSSTDAAQKRNIVNEQHLEPFRQWQSRQITTFLVGLHEKIRTSCQKNLLLDASDIYFYPTSMQVPPLRSLQTNADLMKKAGFDSVELSKAGIGLMGFDVSIASSNLASQRLAFSVDQQKSQSPESLNVHSSIRRLVERVESANEQVKSTPFENTNYRMSVSNSNDTFRQKLVESLAKNDVLFYLDAFELGKRATSSESRRIWSTFAKLPNVTFDTVTKDASESPVIVRTKSIGNQTYVYVLNQTPWPTKVVIQFGTPIVNLRDVNGKFFTSLEKEEKGGTLSLSLEPYDLVGARSDQAELKVSEVQFSFPASLKKELTQTKDRLLAKIRFLETPESLTKTGNPGFEEFDAAKKPVGWTWLDSKDFSVSTREESDPNGNHVLSIQNNSDSSWGWLRSQYLDYSETGRISILLSMKVQGEGESPQVRLSVEGNANGQEYYRFGSFSTDSKLPKSARIESEWKVFAVHFDDVPGNVQNLRVGLDISGKGQVLIDDLKVFDRWFDAQDKEAISKVVSLAAHNISSGDYLKAHRLMTSYWPQFILKYGSSKSSDH